MSLYVFHWGRRRLQKSILLLLCVLGSYVIWTSDTAFSTRLGHTAAVQRPPKALKPIDWRYVAFQNPIDIITPLPSPAPSIVIPKIQHPFTKSELRRIRSKNRRRQAAIKKAFTRSWQAYKKFAYLKDELAPLTSSSRHGFGWATTMVDALDTLWIMGLKKDFEDVVDALYIKVDFSRPDIKALSTFETTIRHLGGLLGAYDASEHRYPRLLEMAVQLGDLLYKAFDTPNHLPLNWLDWAEAQAGVNKTAAPNTCLAELGSLSLEFIRLSQLSGDAKYFSAVHHVATVMADAQMRGTRIPGLWPHIVDAKRSDFNASSRFGLGALSDSAYEYLPKTYLLLGGVNPPKIQMSLAKAASNLGVSAAALYKTMYERAIGPIKEYVLYHPYTPRGYDILFAGELRPTGGDGNIVLDAEAQHLSCFLGGTIELASRIFSRPAELVIGKKAIDGCIWAYKVTATGIMPEKFKTMPCVGASLKKGCKWNEDIWEQSVKAVGESLSEMPKGIVTVLERHYALRPEAIEGVFYHWRLNGDEAYLDGAWEMWENIEKATEAGVAYAEVRDVMRSGIPGDSKLRKPTNGKPPTEHEENPWRDKMPSFWLSETLKYFYLVFDDPNNWSLDEWVL